LIGERNACIRVDIEKRDLCALIEEMLDETAPIPVAPPVISTTFAARLG